MKLMLLVLALFSTTAFAKGRHFCDPLRTSISCELEIALVCGEGYIDGCLTQQTATHRCVIRDEGPACSEDVAIVCPEGFTDACEIGRTGHHQCVPVMGNACDKDRRFICPEGFTDLCDV